MGFLTDIIIICWVIFWIYWFVSAFKVKQRATPSNIGSFIGIRLVVIVVIALLVIASHHSPQDIFSRELRNSVVATLGLIIFLLGMLLAVWARVTLGRNWGMPMTEKEHPELVTGGPYQYVRHPIYGGILLMTIGSLLTIDLFWLIPLVGGAIYFIYSAFSEERLMLKKFPEEYSAYRAKTKMFLPFII